MVGKAEAVDQISYILYIHGSFLCYQIIGLAVAGLPDLLLRLCV